MPRYTAQVWVGNDFPYETEINATNMFQAKRNIARREGVDEKYVNRVFQVSDESSRVNNHYNSSIGQIGGTGGLLVMGVMIWLLIEFTPWILMIVLGGIGLKLGEKITGLSVSDYADNPYNQKHKQVSMILILSLIAGGFGFIQGNEFKNYLNTDNTQEQQQQQK